MCEAWRWMRMESDPAQEIVLSSIDDEFHIVFYSPYPLEYCPWCGAKLPDDEHE